MATEVARPGFGQRLADGIRGIPSGYREIVAEMKKVTWPDRDQTVDATWRWRVFDRTAVSVALFNLFDASPPFARLDQNFDPFTASPLGFTAKLGVSQAF